MRSTSARVVVNGSATPGISSAPTSSGWRFTNALHGVRRRRLADRVGDVDREEVAGGEEPVDRLEADVVGVDVIRLRPAELLHRGVGGGPHARRLASR